MDKETKIRRALAILNEAKSHEVLDKPIPEDDDLKIKVANHLVELARKAREAGENGDHVTAILFTADVDFTTGEIKDTKPEENDPDWKLYKEAIRQTIRDNLPIPKDPPQLPELPFDLTSLSNEQLRFLHGAFNACFARAAWLYAIEEAGEAAAKQIADHKEEDYIINADRKDFGGKPKTAALLKTEAQNANPDILAWRNRQGKHSREANRYKRLRDIYESNVERLSREGTLRNDERRHA